MKMTYIYAYPLDRLPRDSKDEDILNDYHRENLESNELPVRRYTVSEFCALVNDDMFNDQEYYVRPIEEEEALQEKTSLDTNPISELRDKYVSDIIGIMQDKGLSEIEFDEIEDPDIVYVFWQDRYDMWHRDPVVKVSLGNKGLVFKCLTDIGETVTLYTDSDYGCDFVEVLDDIKCCIEEYVDGLEPACPYCGCTQPVDGKNGLLICTDCGNEYCSEQND